MAAMLRCAGAFVLAGLFATSAAAAITDLTLHGSGLVTHSVSDPGMGLIGPAVGSPVTVDASIHLGTATGGLGYPAAPPNDFTGRYTITMDMVFDGYSSFGWSVAPADYASTTDTADEFSGGFIDFAGGKLTDFSLSHVGDPDGHSLSTGGWSVDFGADTPASWSGAWISPASQARCPSLGYGR